MRKLWSLFGCLIKKRSWHKNIFAALSCAIRSEVYAICKSRKFPLRNCLVNYFCIHLRCGLQKVCTWTICTIVDKVLKSSSPGNLLSYGNIYLVVSVSNLVALPCKLKRVIIYFSPLLFIFFAFSCNQAISLRRAWGLIKIWLDKAKWNAIN